MAEERRLCHQCRHKQPNVVSCTHVTENKSCKLKYCRQCIERRYGAEEEERVALGNWVCPKCQGRCNCSVCRKKRGLQPTGILTSIEQRKYIEMARCAREQLKLLEGQERLLPKETVLIRTVAGVELAAADVGPALQFLEYCRVFSQALDIKDGQPESILKEIAHGWLSAQPSMLAELQVNLLAIISTTERRRTVPARAGDVWLVAIERLIDSKSLFRDLPRECFQSASRYHELDPNWKLRILNFLCDLALDTKSLKRLVPSGRRPREIKAHWKDLPSSQKVIALRERLKNEEAKSREPIADGMVLTFEEEEEYERRLSELKEELRKAFLEMSDALKDLKLDQQWNAKRAKSLMSDASGRTYFQIDGYVEGSSILVQDVENRDHPTCKYNVDKWFIFSREDEKVIDDHCSSRRIWEAILETALEHVPSCKRDKGAQSDKEEDAEEAMQDDDI